MQLSKKGATDKVPPALQIGLLIFVVAAIGAAVAGQTGFTRSQIDIVHWQKLSAAKDRASDDKRPVLYYLSGKDSEPSRSMEHVLNTREVADVINERFLPIAIFDLEDLRRGSPEFDLARKYTVYAVPCLIAVSPSNVELMHITGFRPTQLVYQALLEAAQAKTKPPTPASAIIGH